MRKRAFEVAIEALEARQLLTVALNPAGFSVVTPDSSARVVYVSSTDGNDGNSGLSTSAAVATLSKGYSLLRSGYDDQLLLKRGDTWSTTFPVWTLSGESQQFPMLVGTYGLGNLPLIDCGTGDGFDAYKKTVNYVFIQGIDFTDNQRDPTRVTVTTAAAAASPTGFELQQPSTGVTVEDCSFTYFFLNFGIQNQNTGGGSINDLVVRRSVSAYAYCTTSSVHAQGFYAVNTAGITLDQDVFDHNGWNANVSGAGTNGYNHDIYALSTATGLVVTNCIIADASASGVIARGGGIIDGNLFLNDAVGVSFGEATGATSLVGGVVGEIDNNIFMDNHPEGTTKIGQGIDIGNIKPNSGVTVSGNIFADDDEQASAAITLDYASNTNTGDCVGINDLTVADNIAYGWIDGLQIAAFDDSSPLMTLNDVTIIGNQFQSDPLFMVNHQGAYLTGAEHWSTNVYFSTYGAPFHLQSSYPTNSQWLSIDPGALFQQQQYTDPTRTVATDNAALGGTSSPDAFMAVEDAQSDLTWNTGYSAPVVLAYLRAGFAASVNVTAGQTRSLPVNRSGRAVYTDSTLTLAGAAGSWTGTFDIANNEVDLTSASIATVTSQLKQGLAAASPWSGQGITSSTARADTSHLTAVATIQNNGNGSPLFSATNLFDGVDPGPSDILLKYTYFGDANLDGKVDGSDYSKIDNGYQQHLTGWNNGDFNYDGVVDGSDYTLIDNAFNQQGVNFATALARPADVVAVALGNAKWVMPFANTFVSNQGSQTAGTTSSDSIAAVIFDQVSDLRPKRRVNLVADTFPIFMKN